MVTQARAVPPDATGIPARPVLPDLQAAVASPVIPENKDRPAPRVPRDLPDPLARV